jgi:hypothetical protein
MEVSHALSYCRSSDHERCSVEATIFGDCLTGRRCTSAGTRRRLAEWFYSGFQPDSRPISHLTAAPGSPA